MNFKRTAAGITAMALVSGASFTAGLCISPESILAAATKFGDINNDGFIDASDASLILSYYSYLSTTSGKKLSLEEYIANGADNQDTQSTPPSVGTENQTTTAAQTTEPQQTSTDTIVTDSTGEIDASVKTGGDTFTIASWNADDVPYLIAQWKGLDYDTVYDDLANNKIDDINFINFGIGGYHASERYDQLFNDGSDLDVYFCEADWALKYINDDSRTLPLCKLGIGDSDFANVYSYTDNIGKDTNGVRKGAAWQASPGAFAYRADLAEEYLEVKSPEEMQEKVSNWNQFVESAKVIADKSGGKISLADSLDGIWQAYSCGRNLPWVVDEKLVIDDSCKDFADIAKELWDCGGVTKNGQWTDEWTAAGTTDNCMGYFVPSWGFGGFFLDAAGGIGGPSYGKWAVCEGPQPYFWGGTWIVVNPDTDNGEEARDFIISACSNEDNMSNFAVNKPEFVNNTKVMDGLISGNPVFNEKITDNLVNQQNYFEVLNVNAKSFNNYGLITPYDTTIKDDFFYAVKESHLIDGQSWDDTLAYFKDHVAKDFPDLTIE